MPTRRPLIFDTERLGFGAVPPGRRFSLKQIGFDRDAFKAERFNRSVVRPDDDTDRTPRAVLAYIDRVLAIVDPVRTATATLERPDAGPDAAPTIPVRPRGLPIATGTPRDILDYVDSETTRIATNAERARRQRDADRAAVIRGNGYAIGATTGTPIPGITTDAQRIARLIEDIRRDWAAGVNVNGHARAQYTRRINEAVRTLIGRYGLTADEVTARVNGDDA